MRILILGAGAVGGYYGARLLAAGRDVTFLVRPQSAQLLRQHGLSIKSPHGGDLLIENPPLVMAGELQGHYDIILLSCKAYDLAATMESIAPAVGPGTLIIPALNGMAHLAALDARFGRQHVLGGVFFISSVRDADGTIRHLNDLSEILFGDRDTATSPQLEAVSDVLNCDHVKVTLRPNIMSDMWSKWCFIASAAGITCLMRAPIGDIVAVDPGISLRLLDECMAIATAEGYPPSDAFRARETTRLTLPKSLFTASMMRDLEDGAPVECGQILGDLIGYAKRHGIATPLLEVAHTHVRCYEVRRLRELAGRAEGAHAV